MESKQQTLKKDANQKAKVCKDLEFEKRGKERQLKNASAVQPSSKDLELVESQVQREVREREEELERLKIMIRDKKLAMESRKTFASSDGQGQSGYDKLSQEINSVKVMVLNLRANQIGVDLDEDKVAHPVFMRRLHQKKAYSYSLSEI